MTYSNLQEFHESLSAHIPEQFSIQDVVYKLKESASVPIHEIVNGTQYGYMLYVVKDNISESENPLVLVKWSYSNGAIVPVKTIYSKGTIVEQSAVGLDVEVTLLNFNNNRPINGKVDTGADLCALHATDVKINNGSVSFVFGGSRYSAKLSDTVDIVRAGDTQKRSCVNFDVMINSNRVQNVKFTLSDRSGLDSELLIGKNLLSQSGLTIDPSIGESTIRLDYDYIQERLNE